VAARLVRDAAALGIARLTHANVAARLIALGQEAFGDEGEGVVRLEARAGGELVAATRPLGAEREAWHAVVAVALHPGPGVARGTKRSGVDALDAARAEAQSAGVDEALLFDAAGRLVEGARTNLFLALPDGHWVRPDPARGAVAGVALEVVLAADLAIEVRDLDRSACFRAKEIVATNAVRGARPIVALDGRVVGDGAPGPLAGALAAALAAAP